MKTIIQKPLFCTFIIFLVLISHSVFAIDTSFRPIQLAYGITLDVPSHWMVLSLDNRKNIRAAGQAITDNAGIERSEGRKESLLAVMPHPIQLEQ